MDPRFKEDALEPGVALFRLTGHFDREVARAVIDAVDRLLARARKTCVVVDHREQLPSIDRPASAMMSRAMRARAYPLTQYCLGVVHVSDKVLVRMGLKTFFMIAPLPYPSTSRKTMEEALRWCHARLRAGDLESA